jgi:hypothetical protein
MSYSNRTLRQLTISSTGTCCFPACTNLLFQPDYCVGEMLHIRENAADGPRHDPQITVRERAGYPNLLLMCRKCHKTVQADPTRYPQSFLQQIKDAQPAATDDEPLADAILHVKLLQQKYGRESKEHQAAIAATKAKSQADRQKYSHKMIGSDPLKVQYIDDLLAKAAEYWKSSPKMTPGRIGNQIKVRFKLAPKRTRYHLDMKHFPALAAYITNDVMALSPVGRRLISQGKTVAISFEEFHSTVVAKS